MKTQRTQKKRTVRWMSTLLLFGVIVTMAFPAGSRADGTPAGLPINNMATINYNVGGGADITVESSPTGNSNVGAGLGTATMFQVDRKIDLVVAEADTAYSDVPANGTNVVVTFTVTNTGNATQDFDLSALNSALDPFGGTDNLDVTIVDVYVESDAAEPAASWVTGNHTFDGTLVDSGLVISGLLMDYTTNVYVVCNIPAVAANGDIAAITLTAQALEVGGAALSNDDESVGNTDGMETVFVDGAGDTDAVENADFSDTDAFRIQAASLTVTKTSVVVWDPVNTSNYKAIPGAFIEYTIRVQNSAAPTTATASNVVVVDDLTTPINTDGYLAFPPDRYSGVNEITVTAPDINGGVLTELTEAGTDDEGDYNVTSPFTVTVNCGNLAAGEEAVVTFQVEVQ